MRIRSIDVPQANTLSLVVALLALAWKNGDPKKGDIARELNIDPRQVDYYKHAVRILGLAEPDKGGRLKLTPRGERLMAATRVSERKDLLREAVLEWPLIKSLLQGHRPEELSRRAVSAFLKENTAGLTETTVHRRAETVLSWLGQVSSYDPLDPASLAREAANIAEMSYGAYAAREEGVLHYSLKMAIAEDPKRYLGEQLTLVQVEFPFPTNDRADVLFKDERDRLVVVEVEVDVGPFDLPGLLQAVKYKHMLAVIHRLDTGDVRGLLVARKIDRLMKDRAKQNQIESREVPDFPKRERALN